MGATMNATHDLGVLFPDRDLTLAGETVVVREFRFGESLRLSHLIKPITDALIQAAEADTFDGEAFMACLYQHQEGLLELLSQSTGKPREWIEDLSHRDGEELVMAFWEVNQDFFLERVQRAALTTILLKGSPGDGSLPPSSRTETPPTAWSDTRDGNSSSTTDRPESGKSAGGPSGLKRLRRLFGARD